MQHSLTHRPNRNGTRNAISTFLTVLLGISCLLTAPIQAQDAPPNTLTEQEKEDGWKLLFDGETLDGWKSWKTKKSLQPGKWQVKDGALTLTEAGGGDIYTNESFKDFMFKIEFRTTGNSGIFFRVNPEYDGPIWKPAPEIQVLPDKHTDTGPHSAGALYDLYSFPQKNKSIRPDGWNKVHIQLIGNRYEHWFNGQKVTEVIIGGEKWNQKVKDSKFNLDLFGKTEDGHFGLQDHGHKVQFRNIKVKPMSNDQ